MRASIKENVAFYGKQIAKAIAIEAAVSIGTTVVVKSIKKLTKKLSETDKVKEFVDEYQTATKVIE